MHLFLDLLDKFVRSRQEGHEEANSKVGVKGERSSINIVLDFQNNSMTLVKSTLPFSSCDLRSALSFRCCFVFRETS
jgi:hypothetical protein